MSSPYILENSVSWALKAGRSSMSCLMGHTSKAILWLSLASKASICSHNKNIVTMVIYNIDLANIWGTFHMEVALKKAGLMSLLANFKLEKEFRENWNGLKEIPANNMRVRLIKISSLMAKVSVITIRSFKGKNRGLYRWLRERQKGRSGKILSFYRVELWGRV